MKLSNHKKTTTSISRKTGFTLIEMMVAVFVFSVVMVLSTGAIFSIVNANKTSQALKSVMDNLSSALDSMSREVRYGTVYNCGNLSPDFVTPASCSGSNTFAFVARPTTANPAGDHVIYTFQADPNSIDDSGYINKCIGSISTNNCIRLTAPEVHITNLNFYVQGAEAGIDKQPLLLITISGYAQAGANHSPFNIETMVDQRNLACKDSVQAYLGLSQPYCP